MADGYSEIPWRSRTALKCEACGWATTMRSEMLDHLAEKHGVRTRRRRAPAAPAPTLEGIDFASEEAAELAIRANVTAEQLQRLPASGVHGYTVKDVRAAGEMAGGG